MARPDCLDAQSTRLSARALVLAVPHLGAREIRENVVGSRAQGCGVRLDHLDRRSLELSFWTSIAASVFLAGLWCLTGAPIRAKAMASLDVVLSWLTIAHCVVRRIPRLSTRWAPNCHRSSPSAVG